VARPTQIVCRLDNPKNITIMFPGHMPIYGNVSEWWRWKELKPLKIQAGLASQNVRSGASGTGYWLPYFCFKCFPETISPLTLEAWAGR
jgi:hypothetical protein